ncbi:peptidoglycan-binding domain-containing protein [Mesorhizobium sp. CN2-181]|uniref:peptidoglycan-binding domain-containing protein n=1 Tax=Mesorhizobium yinganensis TaxID=3157707 RepID=UPI0032B797AD
MRRSQRGIAFSLAIALLALSAWSLAARSVDLGLLGEAQAQAQEIDVRSELAIIQAHFAGGGPQLVNAQTALKAYGVYSGALDGKWGPRTREAFQAVLKTYIAIGGRGRDWGINKPEDTQRLIDWTLSAAKANREGSEFPD